MKALLTIVSAIGFSAIMAGIFTLLFRRDDDED